MIGRQWVRRGMYLVLGAVCLTGCTRSGLDDQRLARYRPDGSQRRPWEWVQSAGAAGPTPSTGDATVRPTNSIQHPAHDYAGMAVVLRRGDGIIVYLKNIPRPEDIRDEVDEVGAITLPLIGRINVAGMSTSQAEDAIKDAYIDGGFYRKIDVIVVADAGNYYVRGEVKHPGSFTLSGDITLVQAITTAGGYTDYARHSKVKLIRGARDMVFDMDRIEEGERPDPLIKANDTIIVPRRWM